MYFLSFRSIYLSPILACILLFSCEENTRGPQRGDDVLITLENKSAIDLIDHVLAIPADSIRKKISNVDWDKLQLSSDTLLPSEVLTEDVSGQPSSVLVMVSIPAKSNLTLHVDFADDASRLTSVKRTQAELSHKTGGVWSEGKYVGGNFKNVSSLNVPEEHTDHSEFIRYEGPGWESDKVAYRFYLDWRNAVDVFGKKAPDMVLQDVGQDGFSSYHESSEWGMDILKVGKSLGLGSIGFWQDDLAVRVEQTDSLSCTILQNGLLQSKILTKYYGWKANEGTCTVTSDLTIQGGSRLTTQNIQLSDPLPNLCTGIVKHDKAKMLFKLPDNESPWGYLATFGEQSLVEDHMGMAVFFHKQNFQEISDDEFSHVVVLKPVNEQLKYCFAATWEQDEDRISSLETFNSFLNEQLIVLNNPIDVSFE